ncbi:MAG: cytidylate kinase-like family protein [bacterium]|nr:cytidylate kinase-like family protein [Coriobacteriales bacterium]MCR5845768.1 cytidylate kinase-like family protein [bacterium]
MAAEIITISRQYGSGGRAVGEALADRLGYKYYDREVIRAAVEESGQEQRIVEAGGVSSDDVVAHFLSFANGASDMDNGLSLPDRAFKLQAKIMRKLASEGPAVFVGRAADFVLQDCPNLLRIRIFADENTRIQRVMERNNLTEKGAAARIKKIDRGRELYYEQFTGGDWGDVSDIAISTSKFTIEQVIDILEGIIKNY